MGFEGTGKFQADGDMVAFGPGHRKGFAAHKLVLFQVSELTLHQFKSPLPA